MTQILGCRSSPRKMTHHHVFSKSGKERAGRGPPPWAATALPDLFLDSPGHRRYSLPRFGESGFHLSTSGHIVVTHPLKDFVVPYRAGDLIYKEGDPGAEMFVVQSGAVRIFRMLRGQKQELAVMGKGDFFGEMSVLEGLPRTASAEAAEDSELIEINSTVFDRMIRSNIEIAVRMLRKLSSRVQESNRRLDETIVSRGRAPIAPLDLDRPPQSAPLQVTSSVSAPGIVAPGAEPRVVQVAPDWLGALVLGEGEQVFPIRGDHSVIGRYDPVTGTRPEIDLTQHDTNRSVSRRHAKITTSEGHLVVTEEVGALNGTFLNGKRLAPGRPEPIQTGDTLALGMVKLRFEGKQTGKGS